MNSLPQIAFPLRHCNVRFSSADFNGWAQMEWGGVPRMNDTLRCLEGQSSISRQSYEMIAALIGEDLMQTAFGLLLADVRQAGETLDEAMKAGHESRARRIGHKLKGVVEQYGLSDPEGRAERLTIRTDLFWLDEAMALHKLCTVWARDIAMVHDAQNSRHAVPPPAASPSGG